MEERTYQQIVEEMKPFFDACAANWDAYSTDSKDKLAAIATLSNVVPGSRVADIACGTGVMFSELLSRNPSKVLGIDLSSQMITMARQKFGDPRLELVAADLFDVHEIEWDAAIIYNAYPHFPDKQRLVKHLSTMLKKGGRVMVAHGECKEKINQCHMKNRVHQLSWPLRSAKEEAAEFSEYFHMDILVDTPELYMISGIKR